MAPSSFRWPPALALLGALLLAHPAGASGGKLLLTGGVSSIDGAAGGGLTPWALTGSYAAAGQWGGTAHASTARTGDYRLRTQGAAFSWNDRVELSPDLQWIARPGGDPNAGSAFAVGLRAKVGL